MSSENKDDVSDELGLVGSLSLVSSEVAVEAISWKQVLRISVEKWTPSTKCVSLNLGALRKLFVLDFRSFFFEWLKNLALKLMLRIECS